MNQMLGIRMIIKLWPCKNKDSFEEGIYMLDSFALFLFCFASSGNLIHKRFEKHIDNINM